MKFRNLKYISFGLFLVLLYTACKKSPQNEKVLYVNDFDKSDLTGISGGLLTNYNGSKVLGRYNDSGFALYLDNLPTHDLVSIKFDLYIHDSWDGNIRGDQIATSGPDLWQMKVDEDTYINTTFSNSACNDVYCLMQSYPHNYPFNNDSRTGAIRSDLPGVCFYNNGAFGITSLYQIEKTIRHDRSDILLEIKDILKQSNAVSALCDESWSLDNLVITTSILK
jgi:hypothetical protein